MKWLAVVLVLGCGGAGSGGFKPQPGQTYFWRLDTSTSEIGACTDNPEVAKNFAPLQFEAGSAFIYKVSADGKTATAQTCTSTDVKTCKTADPLVTFTIAGSELSMGSDQSQQIGTSACTLKSAESWVATDKGTTMDIAITDTFSLVNSPTDCDAFETELKAKSPNGRGIAGCAVVFNLKFSKI